MKFIAGTLKYVVTFSYIAIYTTSIYIKIITTNQLKKTNLIRIHMSVCTHLEIYLDNVSEYLFYQLIY